ncbi:MAG: FAD-dependent oxidoreductase, partial [Eggerthella lenta]
MENKETKAKRGISRRNFLTGAAVTGLAAAGALAGCSPKSAAAEADAADGSTKPEHRWQSQAAADWRTPPEPVDDAKITDGGTFDVVVVGGGQAGTWTARSAAMNGASVCVVEAQPEDSFFYIGGEVAIANSEWALERGADRIDKAEFMTGWLVRNANRSNQRLIRNFVDYSGQIMDWSISEINEVDPDFYSNTDRVNLYSAESDDRMVMDPSGYQFYKSTIVHRPVTGGGADWEWGTVVMTHHREKAIEEGATWNFNTYAEYLEKDDSGRVVAVVARKQDDDSYVRYTGTRGVVLTAGDFQANVDMIRDINDEYRHLAENYGNIELATSGGMGVKDGAGIKLGVWAGGHVEAGPRTGMNTGQSGPWESAPWGPGFMLLNQRGLRF